MPAGHFSIKRSSGWNAFIHPQPIPSSKERPVYSRKCLLRKSAEPSGNLRQTIGGIVSMMSRRRSSMTLVASSASLWFALAPFSFTVPPPDPAYHLSSHFSCLYLMSRRVCNKLGRRSELLLSSSPECNHRWSSRCPFCVQPLEVVWQNKVPCCSHCSRRLQPEAPAE